MSGRRSAVALALATVLAPTGTQAALAPAALSEAAIAPPPGARLPDGLPFRDQTGAPVRLAASSVPTVLIFADYTCRHICGSALTVTAAALTEAGLVAGRDYRLVVIGMDPKDSPADAVSFARRLDGFPDVASATQALTGDDDAVAAATAAFGYHAVYDAPSDQFAHDAAALLLTPDLRLSAVLPELRLTSEELRADVAAAAAGGAARADGGSIGRALSLCYGFAAAHGLHTGVIVAMLRSIAVLFVLGMGVALWRLGRRRRPA